MGAGLVVNKEVEENGVDVFWILCRSVETVVFCLKWAFPFY